MKKFFSTIILLSVALIMSAQDKTLRVDYIFSGTDKTQELGRTGHGTVQETEHEHDSPYHIVDSVILYTQGVQDYSTGI